MRWHNQMSMMVLAAACAFPLLSEAQMPVPADAPAAVQKMAPHKPEAAVYYLQELVRRGKMTPDEADKTLRYMVFRDARRSADIKAVEGMSKEDRRAYMKARREERGNPLKEYADYCGIAYERAKVLMDAMHDSDKGSKYYDQLNQAPQK